MRERLDFTCSGAAAGARRARPETLPFHTLLIRQRGLWRDRNDAQAEQAFYRQLIALAKGRIEQEFLPKATVANALSRWA